MACVDCGSKKSTHIKHIPPPESRNGWVELSEWTEYCADCATKQAIKMDEVFKNAKESVKNGTIS